MSDTPLAGTPTAITLFCEDVSPCRDFYRRFLGQEPIFEDDASCVFRIGETMVNLLHVRAVPELIDPAPMAAPGARAVYTITVPDVDAACARLAHIGIPLLNGPMDRPWGIRTASVQDPAGHVWELAQ